MFFSSSSFFGQCFFYLLCSYWFYWILVLSISERGLLIYPNVIVDLSHSPFTFVKFTSWILMLLLIAHIFRIILSSWRFILFISCNAICLEFCFVYVNRAVPTYCFYGIFFLSFYSRPICSFKCEVHML